MALIQTELFINHSVFSAEGSAAPQKLYAIETQELSKQFGELHALSGLNLRIAPGTLFGFIGPNGAGKSTAINCMTGLLQPTSGSVRLLGQPFTLDSVETKRRFGVMPEGLALFDQLYAHEFLKFQARMYGLDVKEAGRRARELLDKLDLSSSRPQRLVEFSTGMRKKVAFAAAIIHRPEILFLDEPFESMDAATVSMLKEWLRSFAACGGTVFLTSHVLETVERFCNAAAIVHQGRLVWESPSVLSALGEALQYQGRKYATLEALFLEVVGCSGARFDWR